AIGSVATAVFAIPLLMIASTGTVIAATVVQLGLALLIAIFLGTLPAVFVSFYRAEMRCTALSLGYNVALALFGGTAPLVATVRRQNIWDNLRRDRKEDLAHLLSDVKRLGCDGEDVDSEWSVV